MSKTVLITGTSSGFGKLMVQTFLTAGHTVIATMRDTEGRNKSIKDELLAKADPEKLAVYEMDVSSGSSVEKATQKILEDYSTIDVLINNAGFGGGGITEGFSAEQYDKMLSVNVVGIHRVTRSILPVMRKAGNGLIINVSSVMGRVVIPFATFYTATKYAVEGYSESLRYELKPLGIDVSLIEPGGFGTGFLANMAPPSDLDRVAEYGEYGQVPEQMWTGMGERLASTEAPNPQEVADAALQLLDTPSGERPLRVVVDPMMGGGGSININSTTDAIQKELLTNFGMESAL